MYDLERFITAQQCDYAIALAEIKAGRKCSHWMWYIFPQIKGLGRSTTAVYYSIINRGEAESYMANDLLREHLIEISQALLETESDNAKQLMGVPDDKKLKSSMTLFATVAAEYEVFQKVLDKFFDGKKDNRTLKILGEMRK